MTIDLLLLIVHEPCHHKHQNLIFVWFGHTYQAMLFLLLHGKYDHVTMNNSANGSREWCSHANWSRSQTTTSATMLMQLHWLRHICYTNVVGAGGNLHDSFRGVGDIQLLVIAHQLNVALGTSEPNKPKRGATWRNCLLPLQLALTAACCRPWGNLAKWTRKERLCWQVALSWNPTPRLAFRSPPRRSRSTAGSPLHQ